jgi:hypothetical protein
MKQMKIYLKSMYSSRPYDFLTSLCINMELLVIQRKTRIKNEIIGVISRGTFNSILGLFKLLTIRKRNV